MCSSPPDPLYVAEPHLRVACLGIRYKNGKIPLLSTQIILPPTSFHPWRRTVLMAVFMSKCTQVHKYYSFSLFSWNGTEYSLLLCPVSYGHSSVQYLKTKHILFKNGTIVPDIDPTFHHWWTSRFFPMFIAINSDVINILVYPFILEPLCFFNLESRFIKVELLD